MRPAAGVMLDASGARPASLHGSQEPQTAAGLQIGKAGYAAAGPAAADALPVQHWPSDAQPGPGVSGAAEWEPFSEAAAPAQDPVAPPVLDHQSTGPSACHEVQSTGPPAAPAPQPVLRGGAFQEAAAGLRAPHTGGACSASPQDSLPQGDSSAEVAPPTASMQQSSDSPHAAQHGQLEGLAGLRCKPEMAGSKSAHVVPAAPQLHQTGVASLVQAQTSMEAAAAVPPVKPGNIAPTCLCRKSRLTVTCTFKMHGLLQVRARQKLTARPDHCSAPSWQAWEQHRRLLQPVEVRQWEAMPHPPPGWRLRGPPSLRPPLRQRKPRQQPLLSAAPALECMASLQLSLCAAQLSSQLQRRSSLRSQFLRLRQHLAWLRLATAQRSLHLSREALLPLGASCSWKQHPHRLLTWHSLGGRGALAAS